MKTILSFIFCFVFLIHIKAQVLVKGKVLDESKEPVIGANVYIKGSFDGCSSDEKGLFNFTTNKTGEQLLVVSSVGFTAYEKTVNLNNKATEIEIVLKSSSTELGSVTVSAGSFEASEKKTGTIFKPLDILTTASGLGDIYGALNTLPGTQKVGEKGELFVRGGEGYETRTFIEGLMVQKPYQSNMPDMASRGKFSPQLFGETVFSSGGYSAEYGQALSSALILNMLGLPESDVTSISLMSLGLGASVTKKNTTSSISAEGEYFNLGPYFNLVKQEYDWLKMPSGGGGNINFRKKTGNSGLIKIYGSYSSNFSKIAFPNYNQPEITYPIGLTSNNAYLNTSYKTSITDKISLQTGWAFSDDFDKTSVDKDQLKNRLRSVQARYTISYLAGNNLKIKLGNELIYRDYYQNYYVDSSQQNYKSVFKDNLIATYIEAEYSLGKYLALRAGIRDEYSSILNKSNFAPRISMAVKTSKYAQISAGYGWFYQTPQDDYLRFNHDLNFEHASHYILNYQYIKDKRTFRIEGYNKIYQDLVKFTTINDYHPESYNNNGKGYSRGLDLFYRDQKTFKNGDFWISYSFLDTKRDYKNYPVSAVPDFVSKHNLSFVGKYYVSKITSQLGLCYSFASGRTFYNPNNPSFLGDKTRYYQDISINCSYLTRISDHFTVVYFSVSNVLGRDNVFGYRYSNQQLNDGRFEAYPIKSPAKRMVFLGVFISINGRQFN